MSTAVNRIQFLRGDFRGDRFPLRPPWSLPEAEFVERCERCDDCVKSCPEGLLSRGRAGFPVVDFSRRGCTFCGDCLTVCKGRALVGLAQDVASAWDLKASFADRCLSMNAVVCRSCGEACDHRAIRFRLQVGGVAVPVLDAQGCSGCGECIAVCPVQAVAMVRDVSNTSPEEMRTQ